MQDTLTREIWNEVIANGHTSPAKVKEIVERHLGKKPKQKRFLPFEIGKIYNTKFQTGDKFLIKEIKFRPHSKHTPLYFNGIYVGREHLGICLLNADRLISKVIKYEKRKV